MRKFTMLALAVGVAAVLTACSGGSSLVGKNWQLTTITEKATASQGVVPAADQGLYTIEFKPDGAFQGKANCTNEIAGTYTTTGSNGLAIVPDPATLTNCPGGSLSTQYVAALGNAASYAIASGLLTITLTDGGTLVYK